VSSRESRRVPVIDKRKRPGTSRISPFGKLCCKGEKKDGVVYLGKDFQPSAVRDRQKRKTKKKKMRREKKRKYRTDPARRGNSNFPIHHEILNPSSFILLLLE